MVLQGTLLHHCMTRLRASLQLHAVLNGFRDGIGAGTAIVEPKLAKELSRVEHDPLFLVFLDLWKAYETSDRERLIQTLEGYGTGTCMCVVSENLWAQQEAVPIHSRYHGAAFSATQGMKQGGLISPILFNVFMDNIIQTWLAMTLGDQRVAHNGL